MVKFINFINKRIQAKAERLDVNQTELERYKVSGLLKYDLNDTESKQTGCKLVIKSQNRKKGENNNYYLTIDTIYSLTHT